MVMKKYQPLEDVGTLHPDSIIRKPTVLTIIPVGGSTWDNGVKEGIYPKPIRVSKRGKGWRLRVILALAESMNEDTAPKTAV